MQDGELDCAMNDTSTLFIFFEIIIIFFESIIWDIKNTEVNK